MRPLIAFYSARSPREQRLLAAMLVLCALLLLYLLVVAPLTAAYKESLQEHLIAVDRNGRAKALQAEPLGSASVHSAPDLAQYLIDSARQQGIEASARGSATSATVTIASGSPSAVLGWLSALEGSGFRLDPVRIADAGSGSVSASFTAARGRP